MSAVEPPRPRRLAVWAPTAGVVAAATLSAVAGLLVLSGNEGPVPFLAWATALVITAALAHRRQGRQLDRLDLVAVAAVAGVGAFFRLWRIGDIPSGPWVDELAAAANAVTLSASRPFVPFSTTPLFAVGPEWVRTTNVYLYLAQAVLWITGFSQIGVKLISLLPGITTPPLVYLLARSSLSRGAALLTGGLVAVSHWHVIDSRWGWDQVLVTALTVGMFSALLRGEREERPGAFAVAGILAGLAQYAYAAARMTALAGLAFVVVQAAVERRRRGVAATCLFLAGFAQAVLPMASYWVTHPSTFAVREREVNIVPELAAGNLRPLAENLASYAGMFLVRGDANPRQNLPGKPMLDPVTGTLFLVGLLAAAVTWRHPISRAALLWLSIGLLGGILTDTSSAPNSYRVGLVVPACALLAGIGGDAVARLARARLPGLAPLLPAATGVALVLAGTLTFVDYFVIRPNSRECWRAVEEGAYCEILRRSAVRVLDGGGAVLLDRKLRSITTTLQFDTLLPRGRPGAALRWVDAPRATSADLRRAVLLLTVGRFETLPPGLAALPARPLRTPFGEEAFLALSNDFGLLAAAAR